MANLGGAYEAGNETMDQRDALPAGEYEAALVKSDKKGPNDKGNSYINLEFEVQSGPMEGRRFWSMLNLWNSNSTAVEIAQRELNSLMHACGKLRVEDTEELHGIPVKVKLKVKADAQYGDKNEVKSYAPLNGGGQASGGASFGNGAAQQGGGQSRPWAS